jgi:hypothetical protein
LRRDQLAAGDNCRVSAEDVYFERVEELKRRVPRAELYDAHPAFGLRRSDDEWPGENEFEDLDVEWLARGREEQRRAREAFMSTLLRWTLRQGECRFHAVMPDERERATVLACRWVSAEADGGLLGRLDEDVVRRLVTSRVSALFVYDEQQVRVMVSPGWHATGIWLVSEEARSLGTELAEPTAVVTSGASVSRRRVARAFVLWRRYGVVVLVVAAERLGREFGGDGWPATIAIALAALIVIRALTQPLERRLIARWYDGGA